MKRALSLLLALFCLLSVSTAVFAEEPYSYPNVVDLYFPSNPTTGYSWTVEIEDDSIVKVTDEYFADSSDLGIVGEGGTHWFHFNGQKEGTTHVTFRYIRSWDSEAPIYKFIYRLTVDEHQNVMIWGVEMLDAIKLLAPDSDQAANAENITAEPPSWNPDIDFSTIDTNGKEWTSELFAQAELTMMNMWAYWCPPCVSELPDLQRLSDNYRDKGLQIIGVSMEDYEEGNIKTMTDLGITYPTLRLTEDMDAKMNRGYIPATLFVDNEGHIIGSLYIGSKSYEDWAGIIDSLLGS